MNALVLQWARQNGLVGNSFDRATAAMCTQLFREAHQERKILIANDLKALEEQKQFLSSEEFRTLKREIKAA